MARSRQIISLVASVVTSLATGAAMAQSPSSTVAPSQKTPAPNTSAPSAQKTQSGETGPPWAAPGFEGGDPRVRGYTYSSQGNPPAASLHGVPPKYQGEWCQVVRPETEAMKSDNFFGLCKSLQPTAKTGWLAGEGQLVVGENEIIFYSPTGQKICKVEDGYPHDELKSYDADYGKRWITHLDCGSNNKTRGGRFQTMRLSRLDAFTPAAEMPWTAIPPGMKAPPPPAPPKPRPPMLHVEDMRTSHFHKNWIDSKSEPARYRRLMENIYSEPKP